MAKLVEFVEVNSKWVVFVNPDLVRVIRPDPDQGTQIIFDHDHSITVQQQAEFVAKTLAGK